MDGCLLNMSISALACALAQGKTDDEIALLGVFFSQLGDCLETISTANSLCTSNKSNNANIS